MIFVQLDGVPFPVLQWAVQSGAVPTIRRWLASGDYVLREWTPQLPCTTPASQLGMLHGTVDRVPAFRWYDRELGRVLVANRPADAKVIEQRASDGRGLSARRRGLDLEPVHRRRPPLADDDEPRRTPARRRRRRDGRGVVPRDAERASPAASPGPSPRSSRSAGRPVVRCVATLDPRVHRGWTFAAAAGRHQRPAARPQHRAGRRGDAPRHEGRLRRLRRLRRDRPPCRDVPAGVAGGPGRASTGSLGSWRRLAAQAPRRYRIVALSDHGQSQGRPFADRYGVELSASSAPS